MLLVLYALALVALAVHAPAEVWDPAARTYLFLVGWLAAWRYGWGFLHLARFWWYRGVVFPRRRRLQCLPVSDWVWRFRSYCSASFRRCGAACRSRARGWTASGG